MEIVMLAATGFIAWLVSTVAGARAVAPVVTLGTMLGGSSRIVVFREHVNWKIVRWCLPGAIAGAALGASLFSTTQVEWLQIVLGLVLISSMLQFRFGEKERTFEMKTWYFLSYRSASGWRSCRALPARLGRSSRRST